MLSKKAPSFRASPAGDAIVFWGSPAGNSSGGGQLYALKLDSGVVTRVAPQATIKERSWVFPLALSHDGAWVYFDHLSGDVHRIVRAPTDGSPGIEPLFTLTERPWGIDIGPDGSIYVDQFEQPAEVRWYSKPGTLRASVRVPGANCAALPIDRSRALVVLPYAGRDRLMVVDAEKPDKLLTPFIDTQEETTFPAVALGSDRFAFVAGSGPTRRLAIASTATSRLIGSIDGISPGISSLAATPDGTTVFYDNETDGYIWAKPVAGGEAVRVHEGNGVSMDPHGHYLIVKVDTDGRVRLFNVPWPLGTQVAREIATKTDLGLDQDWFGPRAVWRDGQITVRVGSNHSWYWPSAVLNPSTGTITVLDSAFDRDMCGPGWSYDGQIVTGAIGFQSTLWRFQQGR
jgi:WD40 repeat protein